MGAVLSLVYLAVVVLALVGMWKAFEKAGQPGWAGIVPVYNMYVLTLMAKKPILWFVLLFVPCVGIVVAIMIMIEVAKLFGKSTGFAVGLVLLPFVFWPMLGFGDAKYTGEVVNVTIPKFPTAPPPPPAQ